MANDVVVGPTIPTDLDEALARLADARGVTKAALIQEALADYVAYEEAFVAAVKEGIADLEAGRTVPHEQVVREMEELLAQKR